MTLLDREGGEPGAELAASDRREKPLTVVGPRMSVRQRLTAVWQYRELLGSMTRNSMKVQYKDSALGFLWSLLNPFVTLAVYFVVFQDILKNGIPRFVIFLTAGILVWNFFSMALPTACSSVVANAGIIKKVAFPREIPALAAVGSALIQMGLQATILVLFMAVFVRGPAMEYVPLLIPALVAIILLAGALGVLFAAINVKYRDLTHLLTVALNVWFWATPIIYPFREIRDKILKSHHMVLHWVFDIYRLNPVTPIVLTFQRTLWAATTGGGTKILPDHAGPWWYLWQDLLVIAFALVMFVVALRVFSRAEGDFAEAL